MKLGNVVYTESQISLRESCSLFGERLVAGGDQGIKTLNEAGKWFSIAKNRFWLNVVAEEVCRVLENQCARCSRCFEALTGFTTVEQVCPALRDKDFRNMIKFFVKLLLQRRVYTLSQYFEASHQTLLRHIVPVLLSWAIPLMVLVFPFALPIRPWRIQNLVTLLWPI